MPVIFSFDCKNGLEPAIVHLSRKRKGHIIVAVDGVRSTAVRSSRSDYLFHFVVVFFYYAISKMISLTFRYSIRLLKTRNILIIVC